MIFDISLMLCSSIGLELFGESVAEWGACFDGDETFGDRGSPRTPTPTPNNGLPRGINPVQGLAKT